MPTKNPEIADIENRFKYHPATEVTGPRHDAVRADLLRLAKKMQKDLPAGREKSLVITKLEEAMFWANAAIARNAEQSGEAAPVTPAPSGPTSTRPVKKSTRRTTSSSRKVTRRRRSEPPI